MMTAKQLNKLHGRYVDSFQNLDGIASKSIVNDEEIYSFTSCIVTVLDEAFDKNSKDNLNFEQKKLFERYVEEADSGLVSEDLKQLDKYLGGL